MSKEDKTKQEQEKKPRIRVPAGMSIGDTSGSVKRYERERGNTRDTFQNFSLNLGLGTNNALSDSTYGFLPITRDRTLLEWIYRGSWIAGVAVDSIAEDMTREKIQIQSMLDPGLISELSAGANHFGIWPSICETISWGRLYGGAIGVIMIEGQDPRTPLRIESVGRNQFKGIMCFDRWMVEPDLERMVRGPGDDSLVPNTYWVVASGSGVSFEGMRVHHSRCFRHEGVRLPYWQRVMENMWGISVLERLYDRLIAFDSATNGAAQLVYKSYLRTYAVDGLREIVASGGAQTANLEKFVEFMRRYQGIEGMTLIDAADRFESQGSAGTSFSGISELLVHFGQQISGGLGIPLVRLFGQAPVGLNSTGESDFRNYYDTIHQKQEKEIRVAVDKIYRVMAKSMGIPLPKDFNFIFTPLWQIQQTEKPAMAASVVKSITEALDAGLISKKSAMKELKQSSEQTGIFSNISKEEIDAADALIEPPDTGDYEIEGDEPKKENNENQFGSPDWGNAQPHGRAQLLGGVPMGSGSRGPSGMGLGQNPMNQPSAGGGPGGLGSPKDNEVPPDERARGLRIYKDSNKKRTWNPEKRSLRIKNFNGIQIYIETHKGEHRRQDWPVLPADYGYISMTNSPEGRGEGLDVFVGEDPKSQKVFVVDQVDPETGEFDEQKVLLGFHDRREAIKAYSDAYDDAPSRMGAVWSVDLHVFKKMLENGGWNYFDGGNESFS